MINLKKAIIMGAGPAGLTAAYELLRTSDEYEIIILEESTEIGGISRTVNYKGNRMDIGGHRFFSKCDDIMNRWSDIMPLQGEDSFDDKKLNRKKPLSKEGPDPEIRDDVMLVRDRISRIFYKRKFFDYPISLKMETIKNMGFLTTAVSGLSYVKSSIFKKSEDNLENFYINRFGKKLYSMFFEKYTEKLWGRHPREISADWGSQRVKGLSITALIKDMYNKAFNRKSVKEVETSLIEQFWYPKYGPGQLWELMAEKIENTGGKILKNHQVVNIEVQNDEIKCVVCKTETGIEKIYGDIFISSIPLKDLVNGIKGDKPDAEIVNIADGLPYRDFVTVGLLVNKLELKNQTQIKTLSNIVPDCWIYVQEPDVKLGRIQIFNNWSPYMVKDPENTVWLGLEYFCRENDEFWNMKDKDCSDFAIKELEKMNVISNSNVLDFNVIRVKKAYPAYFDTYKDINKLTDFLNNYKNLFCIGRNGQHRYNNMDHSMLTAIKAVEVIEGKGKKEDIWKVNTEKDYHEEK